MHPPRCVVVQILKHLNRKSIILSSIEYLEQSLQKALPHPHGHPEGQWSQGEMAASRLCEQISPHCVF